MTTPVGPATRPNVSDISEAIWEESGRFGVRLTVDEQVRIAEIIWAHRRFIPTAASITTAFRVIGLHAPRGFGIAVRDRLDRLYGGRDV